MRDPNLTAYAKCSCGSEVLSVEYDSEWEEFSVCIYELPYKVDWKQKFRYIWRIIRTGVPYGDQLIPSKEEMKKIQSLLNGVLGT